MGLLDGRVAIVTGAAQGLCFAVTERFLAEGAKVAMVDLQTDKVTAAARKLDPSGQSTVAIGADVSVTDQVNAMVSRTMSVFKQLDILVNGAGGSGRTEIRSIDQMTDEVWDRVIASNLRSTFLCCRAAVPHLRRSRDSRILNFSSGSVIGQQMRSTIATPLAYGSAKAGIHGFTNQLSKDLAADGVAVNVIQPGFVLTEPGASVYEKFATLTDADRSTLLTNIKVPPREPDEVGYGVTYLMSSATKGVTGMTLQLTGKLRDTNLRITPAGTSPLGPVALVEPASAM